MTFNPLVAMPETTPHPVSTYLDLSLQDMRHLTRALSQQRAADCFAKSWAKSFCNCTPRARLMMLPPHLRYSPSDDTNHSLTISRPPTPNSRHGNRLLAPPVPNTLCSLHSMLDFVLINSILAFIREEISYAILFILEPLLNLNLLSAAQKELLRVLLTETSLWKQPSRHSSNSYRATIPTCTACVLSLIGDQSSLVTCLRVCMIARVELGEVKHDASAFEARLAWVDAWVWNLFPEHQVNVEMDEADDMGRELGQMVKNAVREQLRQRQDSDASSYGDVSSLTRPGEAAVPRADGTAAEVLERFEWPMRPATREGPGVRERRNLRYVSDRRAEAYRDLVGESTSAVYGEDAISELEWSESDEETLCGSSDSL